MAITPHDIAKMLDHSTLQPFLTEADIRKGCELALKYDCASVCARPCDVPILAEMLKGSDVKAVMNVGRNFIYDSEAVSQDDTSESASETTPESTTPEQPSSKAKG